MQRGNPQSVGMLYVRTSDGLGKSVSSNFFALPKTNLFAFYPNFMSKLWQTKDFFGTNLTFCSYFLLRTSDPQSAALKKPRARPAVLKFSVEIQAFSAVEMWKTPKFLYSQNIPYFSLHLILVTFSFVADGSCADLIYSLGNF